MMPLQVALPDCRAVQPSRGSPYVAFRVVVKSQEAEDGSAPAEGRGVWKRYSEFLQLQAALAAENPHIQLQLPPKDAFWTKFKAASKEKNIESRRLLLEQGLNQYLGCVFREGRSTPAALLHFLNADLKAADKAAGQLGESISTCPDSAALGSPVQDDELQHGNPAAGVSTTSSPEAFSPEVESHLERAAELLALSRTACELRSVLEGVTPHLSGVSRGIQCTAVCFMLGTAIATLPHRLRLIRRAISAFGFIAVLALLRQQARCQLKLFQVLHQRVEELEARVVASPIFKESQTDVLSPSGEENWTVTMRGHIAQMVNAWLVRKLKPRRNTRAVQDASPSTSSAAQLCRDGPAEDDGGTDEEAADDADSLCRELDSLYESREHVKALQAAGFSPEGNAFLSSVSAHPPGVLWRVARACYGLSKQEPWLSSPERRRSLLLAGQKLASSAAGPGPDDGACGHKWIAILAMESAVGTRARVEASHIFQQHTQIALASGRGEFDPTLHFIVGRFRAGVLALSWVERRAAQAIYGSPLPSFTWEEALASFRTAASLRPGGQAAPMDLLEIGKCLLALRRPEARKTFQQCLSAEVVSEEDEAAHVEARKLLGQG